MVKSYTDLEQSKTLSKILSIESADMRYEAYYVSPKDGIIEYEKHPHFAKCIENCTPCWSLAALIGQMPSNIKGHELTIRKSYWQIEKTFAYELSYEEDFEDYSPSILVSTSSIELIDACVEMIIKLKEKNAI